MPNFAACGFGAGVAVEARKAPLDLGNDRLVLDRPRRGHHHVRPAIMRREIAVQHIAAEPLQRLRRAEQRASHRLIGIAEFVEMLEHHVVRRVLRRADLLFDDALLALKLVGGETRV